MKTRQLLRMPVFGLLLFQFCSDNDPVAPDPDTKTVKATIGSTGGTLTTDNNVSLIIPSGALQQDTEISVTSLKGDTFDELGIIGARLEPDGLIFNIPAIIRFPLPADWAANEIPAIYEASNTEPTNFLVNGFGKLMGNPGAYFCEVEVSHFSSIGAARNCHAGTINYLLKKDFKSEMGCGVVEMEAKIKESYGNKFSIFYLKNQTDDFRVDNVSMQCFLKVYFNEVRSFDAGELVTETFLNSMVGNMENGRQVVVAFNQEWGEPDNDGFYGGMAHTGVLEIVNGQLKLRQSVSVNEEVIEQLRMENGENVIWYPKDGALTGGSINQFRDEKSGVIWERNICDSDGCLWPESPVQFRIKQYASAKFYVSKYSLNQNPCALGNTLDYTECWVQVTVGSEIYKRTDFISGNVYSVHTCCNDLGGYTYKGFFSGNKFTGNINDINVTGTRTDTITGTITVELNETQDMVSNINFILDSKIYISSTSGQYSQNVKFNGREIPLTGPLGATGTYSIEGSQTCNHILSLEVYNKSNVPDDLNNNYEETLETFECDVGGERITIFFSK